MIERPSARLILFDPQDRLFLFKVHDPAVFDPAYPFHDPFWVMIGGMVDAGEDFAQAAVREADEETKLPVIDTPRWVWTRERRMAGAAGTSCTRSVFPRHTEPGRRPIRPASTNASAAGRAAIAGGRPRRSWRHRNGSSQSISGGD
jgi:8-oxo-dGTP pyrophosphatase MutT (NUDIX family)